MKRDVLFADEEMLACRVILEAGESMSEEIHVSQTETLLVLRGRIVLRDPRRETVAWVPPHARGFGPGSHQDALVIAAGIPHSVKNIEDFPAEFISIMRAVPEAS